MEPRINIHRDCILADRCSLHWGWIPMDALRDTVSLGVNSNGSGLPLAIFNWEFIEDPQGGRPPPHFYSRRFCRSVCRRTQSIRRRRNVKGNFAWGSYGGFLAGSWRILGGTAASSRLNFGKFSAESRQVLGGPKNFQRLPKRQPEGSQKAPRMPKRQPEGGQKASRMPKRRGKGCQKASIGTPKS